MKKSINLNGFGLELCLVTIALFFHTELSAQNFFQVRLDTSLSPVYFQDVVVNEHDDILLLMNEAFLPNLKNYYIIPVSGQQGAVQALNLNFQNGKVGQTMNAYYHSNRLLLYLNVTGATPTFPSPVIVSINLLNGHSWCKRIESGFYFYSNRLCMDLEGNAILVRAINSTTHPSAQIGRVVEIFKYDVNGDLVWKNALSLNKSDTIEYLKSLEILDVAIDDDKKIYFTGRLRYGDSANPNKVQFVIKLDEMGNPLEWRIIKGYLFNKIYLFGNDVYLLDKTSHNPVELNHDLDPHRALFVKLDQDLNFEWGKSYQGENFDYFAANVLKKGPDKFIMAHTTFGAFPAVLTELDGQGNILSQKGFPNFQPQLQVMSDGSLLLGSSASVQDEYQTGNPIIARTDAGGEIPGCPTFPTCLFATDFSLETDTFQIDTLTAIEPDTLVSSVEFATFSFSPYCDYPPAPVPTFSFPDTLCQGTMASTTDTYNRLAQYREWHLTGPGVDSTLRDSFDFSFSFQTPGEYFLEQAVWVLGCRYDYERKITVLPPLSLSLSDSLVCPGQPMQVMATANRPATFSWGNGPGGATLPIAASGTYSVTATDGHCTATDSLAVTVVAELLGSTPPLVLPPDTVGCQPYLLLPQSIFTDAFFLDGGTAPAESFTLLEAGSYGISMEAFGCRFSGVFRYGIDCQVDIYLPNSFSPNGDGINDEFLAFGQHFEAVELAVYDRWGGLLHKGLFWDGGNAGPGQYAYKLVYENLKSGKREELHGAVMLLR